MSRPEIRTESVPVRAGVAPTARLAPPTNKTTSAHPTIHPHSARTSLERASRDVGKVCTSPDSTPAAPTRQPLRRTSCLCGWGGCGSGPTSGWRWSRALDSRREVVPIGAERRPVRLRAFTVAPTYCRELADRAGADHPSADWASERIQQRHRLARAESHNLPPTRLRQPGGLSPEVVPEHPLRRRSAVVRRNCAHQPWRGRIQAPLAAASARLWLREPLLAWGRLRAMPVG